MNMDKKLTCSKCDKGVAYRDKLGKEYCYECYWNLEENKYGKPSGDTFANSDFYRSCPFCNSGDLCSFNYCMAKCARCGIVDKKGREKIRDSSHCSECIGVVREKFEE